MFGISLFTVTKLVVAMVYTNFQTNVIDDEGIEQLDDIMGWPKGDHLVLGFSEVGKV